MKTVSLIIIFFILIPAANGQSQLLQKDFTILNLRTGNTFVDHKDTADSSAQNTEEFPKPKSVLFKSLMVPGWGQITNKQVWKVPIIYGMYAGIGYYTYTVHQDYKDYRAAFYNVQRGEDTDFKFGPTPEELEGLNNQQLRQNRNSLRNRRDLMFIVLALAHGLNALDAYVFAHMRSFDVSDDLTAQTTISPEMLAGAHPGLTLKFQLYRK